MRTYVFTPLCGKLQHAVESSARHLAPQFWYTYAAPLFTQHPFAKEVLRANHARPTLRHPTPHSAQSTRKPCTRRPTTPANAQTQPCDPHDNYAHTHPQTTIRACVRTHYHTTTSHLNPPHTSHTFAPQCPRASQPHHPQRPALPLLMPRAPPHAPLALPRGLLCSPRSPLWSRCLRPRSLSFTPSSEWRNDCTRCVLTAERRGGLPNKARGALVSWVWSRTAT